MNKLLLLFGIFLISTLGFSQEGVTVSGNTVTVKEIGPVWPGCENSQLSSDDCFNKNVALCIKENYKFPKNEKGEFIRGKTTVSFVINEKGEVAKVAAEGPNEAINKEAMRIVKLFPKMKPGHSGGTPIEVKFKMPFTF